MKNGKWSTRSFLRCGKKAVWIFLATLSALSAYLFVAFSVFSPPKVTLFSSEPVTYQFTSQNETTLCYRAEQKTEALNPSELKLLVWNIHKGQDLHWQEALAQFSHETDFLLLQEVSSQQQLDVLLAKRFPYFLYAASFSYHQHFSGVGTFSHAAPQSYCATATKEPWIQLPKVGIATTYPLLNGQSLLVVNLHLVNFEWKPTNYQQQLNSAFQLIAAHQGPIILAGDFNTWNSRRLKLVETLAKNYQFEITNFTPDVRLHFMGNPLDHIFIKGLKVVEASTRKTASSDHNPLFIKLKME